MSGTGIFIPRTVDDLLVVSGVVVSFYIIGGVVSLFAEQCREALHIRGEWKSGTHLLGAQGGRVGTLDQAGTGGRVDRSRGKGLGVANTLLGQCINVGGLRIRISVTSQHGTHILRSYPDYIWIRSE